MHQHRRVKAEVQSLPPYVLSLEKEMYCDQEHSLTIGLMVPDAQNPEPITVPSPCRIHFVVVLAGETLL